MSNNEQIVATEAEKLAAVLPFPLMQSLAESLGRCDSADWPAATDRILQCLSHPHYRGLAAEFLDRCRSQSPVFSSQAVALAVLTAACSEKAHRNDQAVELAWTGPDVGVMPLRRTEQAILQVLDCASKRITVVSYAVYNIPHVCDALIRAARRGVAVDVIVETPDRLEGKNAYDTLAAFGPAVADRCSVYFWPLEHRPKDESGRPGILHVKCAVADGRWLFLSSANLTEYAFTINMELGLLVIGGPLPKQVEEQFDRLIGTKTLVRV
jgi:phosphatidylserine/phosphatidylglycerophosphate/cardiolipin synthase-like enzyme